jgi:hypothetical protein
MNCTEAVLELSQSEPSESSESLRVHLAGCAECRASAQVLALAALPPPSGAEQAALERLAAGALVAWDAREERRTRWRARGRQALRLALAAGLGAMLASGALLALRPTGSGPGAHLVPKGRDEPAQLAVADEAYLQDDEVFFEVSWPEGDQ